MLNVVKHLLQQKSWYIAGGRRSFAIALDDKLLAIKITRCHAEMAIEEWSTKKLYTKFITPPLGG